MFMILLCSNCLLPEHAGKCKRVMTKEEYDKEKILIEERYNQDRIQLEEIWKKFGKVNTKS